MDAGTIPGPGASNAKTVTGSATPAANGILTSFTIAHGLGSAPSYANACAGNVLSAALFFVTSDATNITITYAAAPLTGALSFKWVAIA